MIHKEVLNYLIRNIDLQQSNWTFWFHMQKLTNSKYIMIMMYCSKLTTFPIQLLAQLGHLITRPNYATL